MIDTIRHENLIINISNDYLFCSGVSRSYHDSGSSRRSGGSNGDRPSGGWSSSNPPSLLGAPSGSNDLFSGAAVQAASLMMNASMSRSGGGSSNGTSSR